MSRHNPTPVQEKKYLYVTQEVAFCAAHKLYREELSLEENVSLFGKCANPNWHGHNYTLYVTVKGTPNPETGFLFDLKKLKVLIVEEVTNHLDHKNLNLDVPFMQGKLASTENLVEAFWRILAPKIGTISRFGKLHSLRLYETPLNYVEYFGE